MNQVWDRTCLTHCGTASGPAPLCHTGFLISSALASGACEGTQKDGVSICTFLLPRCTSSLFWSSTSLACVVWTVRIGGERMGEF